MAIYVDKASGKDLTALYTMYKQTIGYEIAKAFYTPPILCISREEEKKLRLGSAYAMGYAKFTKDNWIKLPTKEKAMEFTITNMKNGGYVVAKDKTYDGRFGAPVGPVFASTTIEEALKFIKKQFADEEKANADH